MANPTEAVQLLEAYARSRAGADRPDAIDTDASSCPRCGCSCISPAEEHDNGVARVEGLGPVSPSWVQEHLGADCRFKITPVIDLAGQSSRGRLGDPGPT